MDLADPERTLAIAYAPASARPALAALFALDERMGTIVATTTEPMIGLMRLAWWREALEKLDKEPAPAEPLLRDIATHILPHGVLGATLGAIEDGWAALLAEEPKVARHGRERGRWLFIAAAAILGTKDDRLPGAGEAWALADLAHRHSAPEVRTSARRRGRAILDALPRHRWPRAARPLAMLVTLARGDVASDARRVQGSPRRIMRMLALRLTGR
ncbi:squalene/phytoene synthase family protein [Sphingomonas sp. MMS24-J13]|uniref:squalene/phytoene synthase family protein n=1 Tax=Sphingomonas sp. MMS24-J13 TaxID=3238686 RepID=UPI00384E0300